MCCTLCIVKRPHINRTYDTPTDSVTLDHSRSLIPIQSNYRSTPCFTSYGPDRLCLLPFVSPFLVCLLTYGSTGDVLLGLEERGLHLKPLTPVQAPLPISSRKKARTSLTGLHAGVSFRPITLGHRWLADAPFVPHYCGPFDVLLRCSFSLFSKGVASRFPFCRV